MRKLKFFSLYKFTNLLEMYENIFDIKLTKRYNKRKLIE